MSKPPDYSWANEPEPSGDPDALTRTNRRLREQVRLAESEHQRIARRLSEAMAGMQNDRAMRLAALNLMEDAVTARRAEVAENRERRRVEERLREASRRKDEFLATLAHELRNPLAPIRSSLQLLLMGSLDADTSRRLLEMMERNVNHLARLVDDLLEVSRITHGKIEVRKDVVDLAEIVRVAVETSLPLIQAAKLKLDVRLPADAVSVVGDAVRLEQVISNLLNNAAKYSSPDGHIWLSVSTEKSAAVISVADDGLGISKELLPAIFELFTQDTRNYDRAQGGLGIGLTLARSVVNLHGGSIEAHSDGPGKGSEFVVRLPLAKQIASPPPAQASAALGSTPVRRRIMVADDNCDAAETMAALLRFMGADVVIANDGPSALAAMQEDRPALALLDIGMPGMDGTEVARRVRELPGGDGITLVALTGWGQEEDRRRCAEAGFDHHLLKPVELQTLQDLLASIGAKR